MNPAWPLPAQAARTPGASPTDLRPASGAGDISFSIGHGGRRPRSLPASLQVVSNDLVKCRRFFNWSSRSLTWSRMSSMGLVVAVALRPG